jgi:hypothetical protein
MGLHFLADKIYTWLNAPDSSSRYNEAREQHWAGTSEWLLQHEKFLNWKKEAGHLLWLYGGRELVFYCFFSC